MPEKETIEKAQRDQRRGKAPSTQASEFVHEEIEHGREGKHGARSAKQAIAIGQSRARRAGVKLSRAREGHQAGSRSSLAKQARSAAKKRSAPARTAAAKKAARRK